MENTLRRVGRNAAYWSIATVLIVGLMTSIFLFAHVVHNHWFPVHLLLAPMFGLVGFALIILGRRSPAILETPALERLRRPRISVVPAPVVLMGLGLIVGGLLYGFTAEVDAIVYCFAVSVVVMVLASIVVRFWRRS